MPFAEFSGKRVWYEINGTGEPLIQLHGSALGLKNFSAVTPVLAKHVQVIDYDMVGFGESSPVPETYVLDDWTEDLRGLMDTLGIQKANPHGTSSGGFVALQFAARYPERVGKLVMVGCIARYDTALRLGRKLSKDLALNLGMDSAAEMTAQQTLTRSFLDSPQSEAFLENMRATFRATPVDTYVKIIEATEIIDLAPELQRITAPTLVVAGELSQMSPVDTGPKGIGGRGIAEGVQNGRLAIIPNCGHLVLMERFQEVCDVIVGFLKD